MLCGLLHEFLSILRTDLVNRIESCHFKLLVCVCVCSKPLVSTDPSYPYSITSPTVMFVASFNRRENSFSGRFYTDRNNARTARRKRRTQSATLQLLHQYLAQTYNIRTPSVFFYVALAILRIGILSRCGNESHIVYDALNVNSPYYGSVV